MRGQTQRCDYVKSLIKYHQLNTTFYRVIRLAAYSLLCRLQNIFLSGLMIEEKSVGIGWVCSQITFLSSFYQGDTVDFLH